MKLHIGCGNNYLEDYVNVDYSRDVKADIYFNLERCSTDVLPFDDNTFDEIIAEHTLEHITNILPLMQELHRVAMPDCVLNITVPYASHSTAFEDPTHVRFFYVDSFRYFGQPMYHLADYGYRGDWKLKEIFLHMHQHVAATIDTAGIDLTFAVNHLNNIIFQTKVTMIAQKPIRAMKRELQEKVKPIVQVIVPLGKKEIN